LELRLALPVPFGQSQARRLFAKISFLTKKGEGVRGKGIQAASFFLDKTGQPSQFGGFPSFVTAIIVNKPPNWGNIY
jgi:hypothetical protein